MAKGVERAHSGAMPPLGSKHLEYMTRCLELANQAYGADRETLLAMAQSFQRGNVQIERSTALLAECRAALEFADCILKVAGLTLVTVCPSAPLGQMGAGEVYRVELRRDT